MAYVDGFVVPVPNKNLAAYRRMARKAGKIWREHGALHYMECVADDVKAGKVTSFPQAVKLKPDEVVVFSWIIFAFASISLAASAFRASSFGVLGYLYLMESAALPPPRCAEARVAGRSARPRTARATAIRVMEGQG